MNIRGGGRALSVYLFISVRMLAWRGRHNAPLRLAPKGLGATKGSAEAGGDREIYVLSGMPASG